MLMHILKRLGLSVLTPLFIFLLFATAFVMGLTQIATHPEKVKKLFADSGIYATVVPSLLEQQSTIPTPGGAISVTSPEVQKAITQAVTPSVIQQNAEAAIDGLYLWLDGKTDEPVINFNLTAQKSAFADSLTAAVQQKLVSLPPCSAAQSAAIVRSGTFDPFNATCLPRNTTPASAAQDFKNYLAANESFFDKAKVNTAELKNEKGQSPFDQPQIKALPTVYQWAKNSNWILLILTILTGAGIVFLSRTIRIGLRFIGTNLIIAGTIMFVFTFVLRQVTTNIVLPKIKMDSAALQTSTGNLINELVQRIISNYRIFSGIYIVTGAAAVGIVIYLNRKNSPAPAVQPAGKTKKEV